MAHRISPGIFSLAEKTKKGKGKENQTTTLIFLQS